MYNNFMARRIRLFLAALILVLSLSLLIWGVWPEKRVYRIQPISPSEMQIPTPVSFYSIECGWCLL